MQLIETTETCDPPLIWELLKKEAPLSNLKFKISCVITDKKGRVLGKSINSTKTHPKYGSKIYKTLHAETGALYNCLKRGIDVKGAIAYIYRVGGRCCKPCPCCERTLKFHGIKKIIYTNKI